MDWRKPCYFCLVPPYVIVILMSLLPATHLSNASKRLSSWELQQFGKSTKIFVFPPHALEKMFKAPGKEAILLKRKKDNRNRKGYYSGQAFQPQGIGQFNYKNKKTDVNRSTRAFRGSVSYENEEEEDKIDKIFEHVPGADEGAVSQTKYTFEYSAPSNYYIPFESHQMSLDKYESSEQNENHWEYVTSDYHKHKLGGEIKTAIRPETHNENLLSTSRSHGHDAVITVLPIVELQSVSDPAVDLTRNDQYLPESEMEDYGSEGVGKLNSRPRPESTGEKFTWITTSQTETPDGSLETTVESPRLVQSLGETETFRDRFVQAADEKEISAFSAQPVKSSPYLATVSNFRIHNAHAKRQHSDENQGSSSSSEFSSLNKSFVNRVSLEEFTHENFTLGSDEEIMSSRSSSQNSNEIDEKEIFPYHVLLSSTSAATNQSRYINMSSPATITPTATTSTQRSRASTATDCSVEEGDPKSTLKQKASKSYVDPSAGGLHGNDRSDGSEATPAFAGHTPSPNRTLGMVISFKPEHDAIAYALHQSRNRSSMQEKRTEGLLLGSTTMATTTTEVNDKQREESLLKHLNFTVSINTTVGKTNVRMTSTSNQRNPGAQSGIEWHFGISGILSDNDKAIDDKLITPEGAQTGIDKNGGETEKNEFSASTTAVALLSNSYNNRSRARMVLQKNPPAAHVFLPILRLSSLAIAQYVTQKLKNETLQIQVTTSSKSSPLPSKTSTLAFVTTAAQTEETTSEGPSSLAVAIAVGNSRNSTSESLSNPNHSEVMGENQISDGKNSILSETRPHDTSGLGRQLAEIPYSRMKELLLPNEGTTTRKILVAPATQSNIGSQPSFAKPSNKSVATPSRQIVALAPRKLITSALARNQVSLGTSSSSSITQDVEQTFSSLAVIEYITQQPRQQVAVTSPQNIIYPAIAVGLNPENSSLDTRIVGALSDGEIGVAKNHTNAPKDSELSRNVLEALKLTRKNISIIIESQRSHLNSTDVSTTESSSIPTFAMHKYDSAFTTSGFNASLHMAHVEQTVITPDELASHQIATPASQQRITGAKGTEILSPAAIETPRRASVFFQNQEITLMRPSTLSPSVTANPRSQSLSPTPLPILNTFGDNSIRYGKSFLFQTPRSDETNVVSLPFSYVAKLKISKPPVATHKPLSGDVLWLESTTEKSTLPTLFEAPELDSSYLTRRLFYNLPGTAYKPFQTPSLANLRTAIPPKLIPFT